MATPEKLAQAEQAKQLLRNSGDKLNDEQKRSLLRVINDAESDVPEIKLAQTADQRATKWNLDAAKRSQGQIDSIGAIGADVAEGLTNLTADAASLGLLAAGFYNERWNDNDPAMHARINRYQQNVDIYRKTSTEAWREKRRQLFGAASIDPLIGNMMGEIGPLLPLAFTPKGSGFFKAAIGNAAGGALGGGIAGARDVQHLSEVMDSMTMGAAIGFGATALFQTIPGVRAWAGRRYRKSLDKKLAQDALKLEKQMQEMLKDPEFGFTMADIAGDNPVVMGAQRGASGALTLEHQNKVVKTIVDHWMDFTAKGMPRSELVQKMGESMTRAHTGLRKIAQRNYGSSIDAILAAGGDEIALGGQGYLRSLRSMKAELEDTMMFGQRMSQEHPYMRHLAEVERYVEPYQVQRIPQPKGAPDKYGVAAKGDPRIITEFDDGAAAAKRVEELNGLEGGLTGDELERVLKGHQKIMSDPKLYNTAEFGSMDNAIRYANGMLLDEMKATGTNTARELMRARAGYRVDMTKAKMLKDNVLVQALGTTPDQLQNMLQRPKLILDALRQMDDPRTIKETRNILREYAPELLPDLKMAVMRDIFKDSRFAARNRVELETMLDPLLRNLFGKAGEASGTGRVLQGLFTPREQQEIIRTANALRTLRTSYITDIKSDPGGRVADLTINAISRSAEFMGRFLTRSMFASKSLERLMVDPASRRAVIEYAENGVKSQSGRAAGVIYFSMKAGQWEEEDRSERMQKGREILQRRM